jgi:hypothetical protein
VNEIWNKVKDSIETAATGVIGTKRNVSKVWFNNICEEAIRRRKAAREGWLKDTDNETKRTRFITRRKEADKILRCEKRKFVCNLLERAEQDFKANKTRDMYKTIKNLSGDFKRSERFIRDSNGSLVTTNEGIAKEWEKYFEELLNCEEPNELFMFDLGNINNQECPEPTLEEIDLQIKNLKNNKSPGEDGFQAELLKKGGEDVTQWIWQVIKQIWVTEEFPEDWKTSLICPIHKKGNKQDRNNYRGIALLNVAYKVFSNCILTRIKEKTEQTIGEYQGGFRPGKSTTDQIFIIRQLYQKTWEFDREIHTLFVDFKKAYDSIHRESLINILKEFDFPQKLVNLVSISIMETVVKIKVGNVKSDPVTVKSGLRQGDSISPILFNLVLEKVIREMKIEPQKGIKLRNSTIPLLAYADDIILMDESQDGVKRLCGRLNDAAQKVGLQINEQKTEYMIIGRQNWMDQVLEVDHFKFKRVNSFKYLGSIVTEKNDITKEVAARIQAGNRNYYGLEKLLSSRSLSREIKRRLYTSLIRPVILYGSETWALRKSDENKFLILERRILRKIFGPIKNNITGEWRRRKNIELQEIFNENNIAETIKKKRLRWAGHAIRSQNSLLRMVLEQNPVGKRPLGRPKLRWEDLVKRDIEDLGGGANWKDLAMNRDAWRIGCETGWS